MEDGPPIFSQDNTCPDLLFVAEFINTFVYGAITHYGDSFQSLLLTFINSDATG